MSKAVKTIIATGEGDPPPSPKADESFLEVLPLAWCVTCIHRLHAFISPCQGFEVIKQLLFDQPLSFRFILGVRDPAKTKAEIDHLQSDKSKHQVSVDQVDFSDLANVRDFAKEAISKLGSDKLDYVLLNHAIAKDASGPGPHGYQWCDSLIVNHTCTPSYDLRLQIG